MAGLVLYQPGQLGSQGAQGPSRACKDKGEGSFEYVIVFSIAGEWFTLLFNSGPVFSFCFSSLLMHLKNICFWFLTSLANFKLRSVFAFLTAPLHKLELSTFPYFLCFLLVLSSLKSSQLSQRVSVSTYLSWPSELMSCLCACRRAFFKTHQQSCLQALLYYMEASYEIPHEIPHEFLWNFLPMKSSWGPQIYSTKTFVLLLLTFCTRLNSKVLNNVITSTYAITYQDITKPFFFLCN